MHHGFLHRIGMEVELPLLPRDPEHYRTHVGEFWADLQRATGDGWTILRDPISGGIVGMSTGRSDTTVWSYDASILLLELSLPPKDSLEELRRHFDADLAHVLAVCSAHGLSVLGCGAQPELDVHAADAKKLWRTPKHMLYRIIDRHGWRHERNLVPAAIQPAVDVPVEKATEWVNFFEKLLPLLEPALANSCIERWEIDTQNAECRHWLSWSQMMQGSPDAPFAPIGMPVRPYRDLAEYLQYVYSLPLFFLPIGDGNYKKAPLLEPDPVPGTQRSPSLFELTREERWGTTDDQGAHTVVEAARLPIGLTAAVEYLNFRPARLRWRFADALPGSWKEFRERCAIDPASLLRHTFIEIRSIANQLPGETMLPAALTVAAARARPALERFLGDLPWDAVYAFSRERSFRFDAWESTLAGRPYTAWIDGIVEILVAHLKDSERDMLGEFSARVQRRISPAHLSREAFQKGRRQFVNLVRYTAPSSL